MKTFVTAAIAAVAFALAGCAGPNAPVEYAPTSSMTVKGAVQVGSFRYLPAITGKMKPNQINNTALGAILLDHNIDVFFRDGVFKEFRFVGIDVSGNGKTITGDINQFLCDDLGYSVDWTVDVHYTIKDSTGAVVYDSDKVTKNHTAKFANGFQVLNTQIKDNVEALFNDPAFVAAIK